MSYKIIANETIESAKNAISEAVEKAHTAGLKSGKEAGYEAGQKSERDIVWDAIQQHGNREDYFRAFYHTDWDDKTFRPKYDIKPIGSASNLFRETKIVDLEATLKKCGVVLDTSKTGELQNAFLSLSLKVIPTIDIRNVNDNSSPNYGFRSNLHTIRKIICDENSLWTTFRYATGLENLVIEGVIGSNGLNLQWCTKLSHDSIMSIINALSTTTSGLTVTLSKTAVNNAFETSEGAGDGSTSQEWIDLIATRSNWTISLV